MNLARVMIGDGRASGGMRPSTGCLRNSSWERMESAQHGIQNSKALRGGGKQTEVKVLSRYDETDMSTLHEFLCYRMLVVQPERTR